MHNVKNSRIYLAIFSGSACCLALAILAASIGCNYEVEPSEEFSVTVSPNIVSLAPGASQTFTASGGRIYTWTLRYTNVVAATGSPAGQLWGVLSSPVGATVIYTALTFPSNDATTQQILMVSSSLGGTSTNSSPLNASAEAYIFHPE